MRRDLDRPSRRVAARLAVVGAAAAAIALGVLATLPGGGSASAVDRATAALRVGGETILHVDMTGRQVNPDGSVDSWHDESWQTLASPGDRRQIETAADAPRVESATVGGTRQLYDAASNTIYTAPPAADDTRNAGRAKADGRTPWEESPRAQILDMLQSGEAVDAGRTTIDGRQAVRLVVPRETAVTYYADASTYDPIRSW